MGDSLSYLDNLLVLTELSSASGPMGRKYAECTPHIQRCRSFSITCTSSLRAMKILFLVKGKILIVR